jgi:hypothetical protein
MAEEMPLASTCIIDWDAETDIVNALTMDWPFMNSQNERDQCFHAFCVLRLERFPTA